MGKSEGGEERFFLKKIVSSTPFLKIYINFRYISFIIQIFTNNTIITLSCWQKFIKSQNGGQLIRFSSIIWLYRSLKLSNYVKKRIEILKL